MLNYMLNTKWVNNEIKEEFKIYLGTNESEHVTPKSIEHSKAVL